MKQLEGFNLFFSRYIYPSFVFLKFYHLSCMYLSNCLLLLHSIIFPSQAFSCHSNDHQLLNPRIHTFCRTLPLPSLSRDHENQVASLSFKSDASEIPVSMYYELNEIQTKKNLNLSPWSSKVTVDTAINSFIQ